MTKRVKHKMVRPPKIDKSIEVHRLAGNGQFYKDDGRPSEAFFTSDGRVFVANCSCDWGNLKCPARQAADKVYDIYDIGACVERKKPLR